MIKNVSVTENITLPEVICRLKNLEEQVRLIESKSQFQSFQAGLPGFEFVVEADGEEVWTGLNLQRHYPEILGNYPDKELIITWRSDPVTLI